MSEVHGDALKALHRTLTADPAPHVSLYGSPGSGRTFLASVVRQETGSEVVVVGRREQTAPGSRVVFVPAQRPAKAVRSALLDLDRTQIGAYGLSYLSPVMAEWVAPVAEGSVHKALLLLEAKQRVFPTFSDLIGVVNEGDVPGFRAQMRLMAGNEFRSSRVRRLVSAWVLSELQPGSNLMLAQGRHLPYDPSLLINSHDALTRPGLSNSHALFLGCWSLLNYQRGT